MMPKQGRFGPGRSGKSATSNRVIDPAVWDSGRFFDWCERKGVEELVAIEQMHVAAFYPPICAADREPRTDSNVLVL